MLDVTVDETALFDQVRRITVPHVHGGYCPVTIGHWDQRGYTHCLECPPKPPRPGQRAATAISGDNCTAEGERCDFCGAGLLAAALERFGDSLARNARNG